jgi:hypothetical protein
VSEVDDISSIDQRVVDSLLALLSVLIALK